MSADACRHLCWTIERAELHLDRSALSVEVRCQTCEATGQSTVSATDLVLLLHRHHAPYWTGDPDD